MPVKAGRFILAFKAKRFHPSFINRYIGRFYSYTIIGQLCIGDKKPEDLILAFWARKFHPYFIYRRTKKFHPCMAIESH